MATCCSNFYELPLARLLLGDFFHPGGERLTRQMVSAALLAPGDTVLDVASGNGATARLLAEHYGCRVHALDISFQNLAGSHTTRLFPAQGDACALPYGHAEFDAAFSECALCLCHDPVAALREMSRVIKPGGAVAVSDLFINDPLPATLRSPLAEALCIERAQPQRVFADWLRQAGFQHWRFIDASPALLEMAENIQHRLLRLQAEDNPMLAHIPLDFGNAPEVLAAARQFLHAGGAGYGVWVAKENGVKGGA